MKSYLLSLLIFACILFFTWACEREQLEPDPDARPYFSNDTVSFDTVFTTIGSATLNFKVYNHSNRPLLISSIRLAGGDESFFRLNIDGEPSSFVQQIEVPPDDSLYIFVTVRIDPNNRNNPMIVKDSVVFSANGRLQDVKLIAYGQDVHLIQGEILNTQTWTKDKPYLIYKSVAIDTTATLTIEAGTQIYFHDRSSMIVWGRLLANGSASEPVVFQNDRLEEFYDIIPGQWGTVYIDPISRGNVMDHVIIRNSIAGIQIGLPSNDQIPQLTLSNSQILNVSFAGLYAFGAELFCYNSVFANAAGPVIALLKGGDYAFYHCTIANNGVPGTSRSDPSVLISNQFLSLERNTQSGQDEYVMRSGDLVNADFINCIVFGNFRHELQLVHNKTNLFNFQFDHCLLKVVPDSVDGDASSDFTSIVLNKDPKFVNDSDRYHLNYSLDTLSPAKDAGDLQLLLSHPELNMDLTGAARNMDGKPDLGAIERKEED